MDKELRILILEDDVNDVELVEHELRKSGVRFQSRRAAGKEEFQSSLAEFAPDVILSDYRMHDMEGTEAVRLAHEQFPHVPVVIITGAINEETAVA